MLTATTSHVVSGGPDAASFVVSTLALPGVPAVIAVGDIDGRFRSNDIHVNCSSPRVGFGAASSTPGLFLLPPCFLSFSLFTRSCGPILLLLMILPVRTAYL